MSGDTDFRRELGQQLRVDSIRSSDAAGSGHPTSSMSAADLLAVLIDGHLKLDFGEPDDPRNDHLIFSKGHASPLYYSVLKAVGAIEDDELLTFRKLGSRLEGHPTPILPWVDVATGSLGQGLPIGVGVALAARMEQMPSRVWILCGDSEMAEGSIWEAVEHAGKQSLANLTAIIDVNRLGQTGETMHGWDLRSYAGRAEAAGWNTLEIDGHDLQEIEDAYANAEADDRPTMIVARTKKGKGAKEVEDQPGKHGKPLEDPAKAIEELGGERDLHVDVAKPEGDATPYKFPVPGGEMPTWEKGEEVRDAESLRRRPGGARRAARRHRRARRRGRQLDPLRRLQKSLPGPLHRGLHRRAADGRGGGRLPGAAPLDAVRLDLRGVPQPRPTTSSAWRRSAAPTSASSAPTPASRSARTGRRRWRSRTSPACAPCTARPCSTRATRPRPRPWSRSWPTPPGSPTCAPPAARRRCSTTPTRNSRSAARRRCSTAPT